MESVPPPLPAELEGLVEIVTPDPVAWRPQTAGWAILGVLVLVGLGWWLWRFYRRWKADAYRRAALVELRQLDPALRSHDECPWALQQLSSLLKRTALAAFPRARVAELSGDAWLRFLDDTMPGSPFSDGPGRVLAEGPYERDGRIEAAPTGSAKAAPTESADVLLRVCEGWIRGHRPSGEEN